MAVTVKIDNIETVVTQLTKYKDKVSKETIDTINQTMLEVRNGAVRSVPVDVGRLRSSITLTKMNPSNKLSEVYTNVEYAPFIEFGTKSKVEIPSGLESYASQFQRTGGSFDMLLENIRQWCRHKGIDEAAAFPIARKIAKEGIKAQPYLFPAFEKERAMLLPKLDKLLRDA